MDTHLNNNYSELLDFVMICQNTKSEALINWFAGDGLRVSGGRCLLYVVAGATDHVSGSDGLSKDAV